MGFPYHSPHKFRHGNAVYSLKLGRDLPALKAISQNLMHSNISITDGVYGNLSENDVRDQIKLLTRVWNSDSSLSNQLLSNLLSRLLNELSVVSLQDQENF